MGKTITQSYLTGSVNGISINTSKKCNSSNYNNNNSRVVSYIVFHYTGNKKDTASANANYFTGANRNASAHFFIDDGNIYQSVELRDTAWHCGGSKYYHSSCRNSNSIGIEMCCTAGNYKISAKTITNSAHLCARLCKELGISASEVDTYVLRHYDITHKKCPAQMVDSSAEWVALKNQVKSILGGATAAQSEEIYRVRKSWADVKSQKGAYMNLNNAKKACDNAGAGYEVYNNKGQVIYPVATTASTKKDNSFQVKVTASGLRIRQKPTTLSKKMGLITDNGVYTIVETSGNWGKLKSGAGWIHLGYTKKI